MKQYLKMVTPFNFVSAFLLTIIVFISFISVSLWLTKNSYEQICANSKSCVQDLTGAYHSEKNGVFLGKIISLPDLYQKNIFVLGQTSGASKQIYIDLAKQQLTAYEGEKMVFDFPISSGKWYPTPTGIFRIWIKLRWTKMEGGNPATGTYYNLPNVPHVMYFYNDEIPKTRGFGLHGAYWHTNFGHPMSHGCINIGLDDVAKLYEWVDPPSAKNVAYATKENPGTQLTIFGTAPKE